jgi:50S ribosomal protein L16 3-hydroxylase
MTELVGLRVAWHPQSLDVRIDSSPFQLKPRNRLALDRGEFMRRHWQREPLLVRRAFARFEDPLSPSEVLALAGSPDAVSRLVVKRAARWSVEHGPIPPSRFKQLPSRGWTVLVQDTNHFSARAAELLACFDFVPHARIDDVMVSYAAPGGGVGPHVDSYDVFLLQGRGRRRWQVSGQKDHSFVPGLDLKILQRFVPQREWVLEPGDMLYLPPGIAHHGVAESECLTWSIGFRAPTDREIVAAFLDYLHENLEPRGQYRDPGAAPARRPAEIPAALVANAARALRSIRWSARDVREFAGRFLSEPKAHVYFTPPRRPLARAEFGRRAARSGLALDARARLLTSAGRFFLNGETVEVPARARVPLRRLADERRLSAPVEAPREFWDVVHAWYLAGYLHREES